MSPQVDERSVMRSPRGPSERWSEGVPGGRGGPVHLPRTGDKNNSIFAPSDRLPYPVSLFIRDF